MLHTVPMPIFIESKAWNIDAEIQGVIYIYIYIYISRVIMDPFLHRVVHSIAASHRWWVERKSKYFHRYFLTMSACHDGCYIDESWTANSICDWCCLLHCWMKFKYCSALKCLFAYDMWLGITITNQDFHVS